MLCLLAGCDSCSRATNWRVVVVAIGEHANHEREVGGGSLTRCRGCLIGVNAVLQSVTCGQSSSELKMIAAVRKRCD